jgi:hypothetical protein
LDLDSEDFGSSKSGVHSVSSSSSTSSEDEDITSTVPLGDMWEKECEFQPSNPNPTQRFEEHFTAIPVAAEDGNEWYSHLAATEAATATAVLDFVCVWSNMQGLILQMQLLPIIAITCTTTRWTEPLPLHTYNKEFLAVNSRAKSQLGSL